ncbi:unnamed protein product [Lepeophtheirus salmonis]|uniref:(salmon louse) hypothetical protein n=1 Tax=Lepeophtheirus salmonis TaxID=72036 RepID=A0A7R8CAP2_LEPSM|nr:unnamed protein product [Lepeophtheirus salmonis]CAF2753179.1 unnamed protein product [Lepeophtheirus salmonis]
MEDLKEEAKGEAKKGIRMIKKLINRNPGISLDELLFAYNSTHLSYGNGKNLISMGKSLKVSEIVDALIVALRCDARLDDTGRGMHNELWFPLRREPEDRIACLSKRFRSVSRKIELLVTWEREKKVLACLPKRSQSASANNREIDNTTQVEFFNETALKREMEPITEELTSLELQAALKMQRTAPLDTSRGEWFIKMPWIDSDPNGRIISDNSNRAIAVMHRVHDKVKPEHMNLVEEAYQEFLDLDYAEEVPSNERITKHPSYVLTSPVLIRTLQNVGSYNVRLEYASTDNGTFSKYPIASEVIDKMTYMDDIHIAQDTLEKTIQTTLEILKILESGGFYGHKIEFLHPEIPSEIEQVRIALSRDNGYVGSRWKMLKFTQTKGLITQEGGTDRFSIGGEPIQDSDKVESNDTAPGKEAITSTFESVLIPPQPLEDAEDYSTGFNIKLRDVILIIAFGERDFN